MGKDKIFEKQFFPVVNGPSGAKSEKMLKLQL